MEKIRVMQNLGGKQGASRSMLNSERMFVKSLIDPL